MKTNATTKTAELTASQLQRQKLRVARLKLEQALAAVEQAGQMPMAATIKGLLADLDGVKAVPAYWAFDELEELDDQPMIVFASEDDAIRWREQFNEHLVACGKFESMVHGEPMGLFPAQMLRQEVLLVGYDPDGSMMQDDVVIGNLELVIVDLEASEEGEQA